MNHKRLTINYKLFTIYHLFTLRVIEGLFTIYHLLFPSAIRSCRYEPTCSQYFLDATDKYGLLKGSLKTINRISSCHPLSKRPYLDPA